MKVIATIVIILFICIVLCLLWKPKSPLQTGTRSYYGKDRYLLATVNGDYLDGCFVPMMDILSRLSQEQRERIVLVETIPDGE